MQWNHKVLKALGDIHEDTIQSILLYQIENTQKQKLVHKVNNFIDVHNFQLYCIAMCFQHMESSIVVVVVGVGLAVEQWEGWQAEWMEGIPTICFSSTPSPIYVCVCAHYKLLQ